MNELTLPAVTTGCWPWPGSSARCCRSCRWCGTRMHRWRGWWSCTPTMRHYGQRSRVTGHRPGRSCHGRQPRACSRRGCHRRGAADPPAARPGRTAGPGAPAVVRAAAATLALAPVLLALAPAAAALALGRVPAT